MNDKFLECLSLREVQKKLKCQLGISLNQTEKVSSFLDYGNVVQCFITGRNEVVAKVIFLHLSVILFTGGGSASVHAGIPPPPGKHTPPGSTHPAPPPEADSGIRSMSGQYASYWNAFLFWKYFYERTVKFIQNGCLPFWLFMFRSRILSSLNRDQFWTILGASNLVRLWCNTCWSSWLSARNPNSTLILIKYRKWRCKHLIREVVAVFSPEHTWKFHDYFY